MNQKIEGLRALAYGSLMCGLSTIFILASTFIPGTCILSLLLLPLFTTMVVLKVSYRYVLIYSCALVSISLIDPLNSLFIVIPSIITGLSFGVLIKKYIHGYYIIFFSSLVLLVLQIGAKYAISLIYEQDMQEIMGQIMHFKETTFAYIFYIFLFLVSLAQATLTYVIGTNELTKLGFTFNEKKNDFVRILIITMILLISSISLYFINISLSYLFICFTLYFGVILAYYNFSYYETKFVLYLQIPLYVLSLLSFFVIASYVDKFISPYFILLIVLSEIIMSLSIIVWQKIIKKGIISESIFDKLN